MISGNENKGKNSVLIDEKRTLESKEEIKTNEVKKVKTEADCKL